MDRRTLNQASVEAARGSWTWTFLTMGEAFTHVRTYRYECNRTYHAHVYQDVGQMWVANIVAVRGSE